MHVIPREGSLDSTLALMREPYDFVSSRCRRHGSDLFQARILLRRIIFMTGPEAAELFYDQDRFLRRGATPEPMRKTRLGEGDVQGLDDAEHRHRKAMFMSLMTAAGIARLADVTAERWRAQATKWASMDGVVLYPELQVILTRAACAWAGVPLAEPQVGRRTKELTALFDAVGAAGPRHLWARLARRRWIAGIVDRVRAGQLSPPAST